MVWKAYVRRTCILVSINLQNTMKHVFLISTGEEPPVKKMELAKPEDTHPGEPSMYGYTYNSANLKFK